MPSGIRGPRTTASTDYCMSLGVTFRRGVDRMGPVAGRRFSGISEAVKKVSSRHSPADCAAFFALNRWHPEIAKPLETRGAGRGNPVGQMPFENEFLADYGDFCPMFEVKSVCRGPEDTPVPNAGK